MNSRRADAVVAVLIGFVLVAGGARTWWAYRQRRAVEESMGSMQDSTVGSMLDSSMGAMHGPDPLWYAVGTLLVASVLGGVYLLVRGDLTAPDGTDSKARDDPDQTPAEKPTSTPDEESQAKSSTPESDPQARVLDLLPDDERRVLGPVLDSPGITQIELRDRSDFSKSKVSQTASSLERRGLLYRERHGRTYRVYPSDDLRKQRPER